MHLRKWQIHPSSGLPQICGVTLRSKIDPESTTAQPLASAALTEATMASCLDHAGGLRTGLWAPLRSSRLPQHHSPTHQAPSTQDTWHSWTITDLSTGTFFSSPPPPPPGICMLVPTLPSSLGSNVTSLHSPLKTSTFHLPARLPIILSHLTCYLFIQLSLFLKFISLP